MYRNLKSNICFILCTVILRRTLNVILGFIPRIQQKHLTLRRHRACPDNLDPRDRLLVTPEDDYKIVQCGRSMIEMLGVLAIVGVLSVGGIAGYSRAMEQFKINRTINYLERIVTNIQTLYMQQNSYEGLNTQTALSAGIYPEDKYQLPLGEDTSMYLMPSNDGLFFVLRICGLTVRQCVALSTARWGGNNENGLYAVSLRIAFDAVNIMQQNGKCVGSSGNEQYFFACATNGNNNITFNIANKYCEHEPTNVDGRCIGLFFK